MLGDVIKKIRYISIILILLPLIGCDTITPNVQQQEQPVLYYKTIDVKVISNYYKYWYACGSHYYTEITVKSDEYNLQQTFTLEGFDAIEYKDLKEGDVTQAQLYSWKMEKTGNIVKREIHCLGS